MSKSFDRLKNALKRLPGTGVKSAERMALHLALENRADAIEIAESITAALERITPCPECFGLSENGQPCGGQPHIHVFKQSLPADFVCAGLRIYSECRFIIHKSSYPIKRG